MYMPVDIWVSLESYSLPVSVPQCSRSDGRTTGYAGCLTAPGAFVTLASVALVIGFVPHLYTLAITITYLLLAALFYPSVRVMSECKDTGTLSGWAKHPGMLSESYHDNHHANLPHEADSGNTDISAQYESLKPNENEK